MGGYGSGYHIRFGTKETTEASRAIDIRILKKMGWIVPNTSGALSWTCRGKPSGNINYHMESDRMVLDYNIQVNSGDWQPIKQIVRFDWTSCHFGGYRQWLLCPGCDRRIGVLYGAGKLFLCRHCYGLTYATQQETRPFRLLRRARKIKERLGVNDPTGWPVIKPKGMHNRTFLDLRLQLDHYEHLGWREAARALGLSEELGL